MNCCSSSHQLNAAMHIDYCLFNCCLSCPIHPRKNFYACYFSFFELENNKFRLWNCPCHLWSSHTSSPPCCPPKRVDVLSKLYFIWHFFMSNGIALRVRWNIYNLELVLIRTFRIFSLFGKHCMWLQSSDERWGFILLLTAILHHKCIRQANVSSQTSLCH